MVIVLLFLDAEAADPSRLNYFITLNTQKYGGDSDKILSTSTEKVSGFNFMQVNYEVYKCKNNK
jgi:hypothetical protein